MTAVHQNSVSSVCQKEHRTLYIYITCMYLVDAFIQSDLSAFRLRSYHFFFISMCVPWKMNPQPFALLTQCSITETQEHRATVKHYLYMVGTGAGVHVFRTN